MNWEKGPVCGIDNCPATFWRENNGRTFCRYGHERQNEVEFDNEDEATAGRVVNIGEKRVAVEEEDTLWFGPRQHALLTQIFQRVLRFYTLWMIDKLELDQEFEQEVFELWSHLIKYTDFGRANYELADGGHSEGHTTHTPELVPLTPATAVIIVFLALLRVGYPMTPLTLLSWMRTGDIPLDGVASELTPEEAKKYVNQIPKLFTRVAPHAPSLAKFDSVTVTLSKMLAAEGIVISQPRVFIFMDAIRYLMLPLDIMERVMSLVKGLDWEENLSLQQERDAYLASTCAVVFAARVAYYKTWSSYDEVVKSPYWTLWMELTEIFYEDQRLLDAADVPLWNDDMCHSYMDRYEKEVPHETIEPQVVEQRKRLNDLFELPSREKEKEEPKVTIDDMLRILNEQMPPLPGKAPLTFEFFRHPCDLQGPPIFKSFMDIVSIVTNLSPFLVSEQMESLSAGVRHALKYGTAAVTKSGKLTYRRREKEV